MHPMHVDYHYPIARTYYFYITSTVEPVHAPYLELHVDYHYPIARYLKTFAFMVEPSEYSKI